MTVIDADAHLFRRYVAQHGGILGAFAGYHLDAGVADIGWMVLRSANKQAAGSGQTQTDCVLRRAPGKNLHSAVSNICPPPTGSGHGIRDRRGVTQSKPAMSRPSPPVSDLQFTDCIGKLIPHPSGPPSVQSVSSEGSGDRPAILAPASLRPAHSGAGGDRCPATPYAICRR